MPDKISIKTIKKSCCLCNSAGADVIAEGKDYEYSISDDSFTAIKCHKCGLVYLSPRPANTELDKIYPSEYIPYHFDEHLSAFMNTIRSFVQRQKVNAIKKFVSADASILDVGCGNCGLLRLLRKYGNPSWHISGVDFSKEAVAKAKVSGFTVFDGRFEDMDVPKEKFDIIIMNQVLEHFDDPGSCIEKSRELLKKGGILFIETPSIDGWDAHIFKNKYWGGWHFPRHWTLFTKDTAGRMLDKYGFKVLRIGWMLSPNFWVLSLHNALVAHNAPAYVTSMMDCKNPLLMALFSAIDVIQINIFGRSSNMRIVAAKQDLKDKE